jgi:hypothetical protein
MSSEKQIAANQRNGRKSRGPRTAAGKAVSSRNAMRHGLASISRDNAAFAPRIEAIARAICPDTSNSLLFEQALIIGETTCILSAVRTEHMAQVQRLREQRGSQWDSTQVPSNRELGITYLPLPELDRLYRYERRALSRRNRAVQKWIEISRTMPSPSQLDAHWEDSHGHRTTAHSRVSDHSRASEL